MTTRICGSGLSISRVSKSVRIYSLYFGFPLAIVRSKRWGSPFEGRAFAVERNRQPHQCHSVAGVLCDVEGRGLGMSQHFSNVLDRRVWDPGAVEPLLPFGARRLSEYWFDQADERGAINDSLGIGAEPFVARPLRVPQRPRKFGK